MAGNSKDTTSGSSKTTTSSSSWDADVSEYFYRTARGGVLRALAELMTILGDEGILFGRHLGIVVIVVITTIFTINDHHARGNHHDSHSFTNGF